MITLGLTKPESILSLEICQFIFLPLILIHTLFVTSVAGTSQSTFRPYIPAKILQSPGNTSLVCMLIYTSSHPRWHENNFELSRCMGDVSKYGKQSCIFLDLRSPRKVKRWKHLQRKERSDMASCCKITLIVPNEARGCADSRGRRIPAATPQ